MKFIDFQKGYGVIGLGHCADAAIDFVIVLYFVILTATLILRENVVREE